jgi:hypothetical protein
MSKASFKPHTEEHQFVPTADTYREVSQHYFDDKGAQKASSRTTPVESYKYKPGTWRMDSRFGPYGREIEHLSELDPKDLHLSEEDYTKVNHEGRGDDAKRYSEWMKQGKTPPPISTLETDDGKILVTDGHRRVAAAKMAGGKVLAWVSPRMDTGKRDSEGKPIYSAMTFEGMKHGPEKAGQMYKARQQKMMDDIEAERKAKEEPKKEEYKISHRPNEDGPQAHDLLSSDVTPKDIYEHPEWYTGDQKSKGFKESVSALKKIRGNPDAEVTIYRASPKNELNHGDWVSLSHSYSAKHGMADDPSEDVPVHAFKVKAKDIRWAGDTLEEFGYYPEKSKPIEMMTPKEYGVPEHEEEPHKPSGEKKAFGERGIEGADPKDIERWKSEKKAHSDWSKRAKEKTRISNEYWNAVQSAIKNKKPIHAEARKFIGGEDPAGYVRDGDRHVYKPSSEEKHYLARTGVLEVLDLSRFVERYQIV